MNTLRIPSGMELIAKERHEQIEKHGWDIEHDNRTHYKGELLDAVKALLEIKNLDAHKFFAIKWEAGDLYFNLVNKSPIEQLAVAGAWIAAEIDRLQYIDEEEQDAKDEEEN